MPSNPSNKLNKTELAKVAPIIAKLKRSIGSRYMSESERKALEKPSFWVSDAKPRRKADKAGNSEVVYKVSRLALSLGSIVKVGEFYMALSGIDKYGYAIELYDSEAKMIDSFRARKGIVECKLSDNIEVCLEIKEAFELGLEGKLKIVVGYVGLGPGQ